MLGSPIGFGGGKDSGGGAGGAGSSTTSVEITLMIDGLRPDRKIG
jgi:hypothetical protein